jgi:putative two-component system response regulator
MEATGPQTDRGAVTQWDVQFRLPIEPSGAATMTAKVMVVEDDDFVRLSLEHLLKARGYEVITAAGGREALDRLQRESVDLVLTDLHMPGVDGLEVLRKVKSKFPDVAVILLTGYSSLDSAIQAMRHEASDYLLKPCKKTELVQRIEAALIRREVYRHLSRTEEDLPAIAALVTTVEAHDPYTRGHSERVAHYAAQLAQEMRFSPDDTRDLWLAGLLHDIGKIGVRDAILYKPGPLTDAEYRLVKKHPVLAAQILAPIAGLRRIVPIVLHHHERYDGGGYPDGLRGESIPLSSRLLAVADGFEAMISDRAYRVAFSVEQALETLEYGGGTQWDPEPTRTWVRLVREGRLVEPPQNGEAPIPPGG